MEQQQLWLYKTQRYANYEDAFLLHCLPYVMKLGYTPSSASTEQAKLEGYECAHHVEGLLLDNGYLQNLKIQRSFLLDGLEITPNLLFTRKFIPSSAGPNMMQLVPAATKVTFWMANHNWQT